MNISPDPPATPDSNPAVRSRDHSALAILALDLGTVAGFALRTGAGAIVSGTVSFRPSRYEGGGIRYLRFRAWLDGFAKDAGAIGVV